MPPVRSPRLLILAVAAAAVLPVLVAPPAAAEETSTSRETVTGELVRAWPEHEDPEDAAHHAEEGPLTWVRRGDGEAVRVDTADVEEIPVGATVEVTLGEEVAGDAAAAEGL